MIMSWLPDPAYVLVKGGDPRRGGERGSPYGPAPGGQSGSVTQEILRAAVQSYQSVRRNEDWISPRAPMLRAVDTTAGCRPAAAAAFFDLDKTIISRSSTLAFVPSFYRYGLINRVQAARGAFAQLVFRLGGADHDQMQRIKEQVSRLCQGWPVERVTEIVTANLAVTIAPLIGAMLCASGIIATQMRHAAGRYTGEMDFYTYGEGKAARIRQLAGARLSRGDRSSSRQPASRASRSCM